MNRPQEKPSQIKDPKEKEEEVQGEDNIIDTSIFTDHIKQKFKGIISQICERGMGEKILLVDPNIYPQLKIVNTKELKEDGIDLVLLEDENLHEKYRAAKHVIFFTQPTVFMMNRITKIIRLYSSDRSFYVIFSPRRTFACKEALERNAVYNSITHFYDFNFDLIPIESDVLSLEMDNVCRELYLDLDTSSLILIAESIQRLQTVYGKVGAIYGKGHSAKMIQEILKNLEVESKLKQEDSIKSDIDCLVILDRNIDFVTPMFSQFTYQGFMDETFGIIENKYIKIDQKYVSLENKKKIDKNGFYIHVLGGDSVFKEIKNLHNAAVSPILDQKIAQIQELRGDKSDRGKAPDLDKMAQALQRQKKILEMNVENVALHIDIRKYFDDIISKPSHFRRIKIEQSIVDGMIKIQDVLDYIEVLIAKQADFAKTIRLLSLLCLVENGIKQVHMDAIQREILQSYGFNQILTLSNLEKVGLLKRDGQKKIWDTLNKALNLVNPDVDLVQPNDAAFAYDGYCSILVRLVEQVFKKDGWAAINEALNLFPKVPTIMDEKKLNSFLKSTTKQVILVYIVGGLTYGEIAALRYLAKAYNKEILIATTSIINGDKLINQFKEKVNK